MPNTGPQVRIPESLMASLRAHVAEDTKRFGGAKKATPFGELLERAWAVYCGRPDPTPQEPEDDTVQQLKEILASGYHDIIDDTRRIISLSHRSVEMKRHLDEMLINEE